MKTSVDFSESSIDIETSLDRVLDCGCERFAGQFYQLLFEGFPELKEFFLGVNMQHQVAMLTMAIQVIVQHYRKPRRCSKEYLVVVGSKNSNEHIG